MNNKVLFKIYDKLMDGFFSQGPGEDAIRRIICTDYDDGSSALKLELRNGECFRVNAVKIDPEDMENTDPEYE